ncbi:MAG: trigger factor [Oleispira sp.]|jgi:trigger factor
MQISIETTQGLERKMTIGVPAADVDGQVVVALKSMVKGRKIDGFRQGKIPPNVAHKMFGKPARQEAVQQVMQRSFFEAISKEGLKMAGMPTNFEAMINESGKDLEFVATFEVYPEITLVDLASIEVNKKKSEVTDADVETMVETLQKQQAKWETSTEAAVDGDQTVVDFDGFIDGEAFEGGKAESYNLTLGSKSMIPGFETGIEGLKAGDEKTLELSFPADYHKEDLRDKAVEFKIAIKEVKKPELAELNEEFFKGFGVESKDLASFKVDIRANMNRELERAIRNDVKNQVIDGLVTANPIDVPGSLADQEIDRLRQQAVQQFGGGQGIDASMLPAELFKEQADRRVRVGLLMNAAVDTFKLTASEEKIDALIEEVASTYQEPEQVREYYKNTPEQKSQVEALALEEQVVEKILESAKVTETEAGYEEVIKAANATQ